MATEAQIIERPKMKRQPRKRLIRARAYSLIKAVGLSSVVLAKRSGYSHRQTLYALDGRRTCPERVEEVLRAMIGPDGWRYLCGEADSVTLTRTFEAGTEHATACDGIPHYIDSGNIGRRIRNRRDRRRDQSGQGAD